VKLTSLLGIIWDSESGQIRWPGGGFTRAKARPVESGLECNGQCGRNFLSAPERFLDQLATIPEIRQDRVTQLWFALQAETYTVSSRQIADAMLSDLHIVAGRFD
jgi:hypothetical protein